MKFFYALSLLIALACMVLGASAQICTADYTPVCATNGRTYSNMCRLKGAGARLAHKGECRK